MYKTARSLDGLACGVAALVAACGLATPAMAAPQVLDWVPEKAAGVVAINNLGGAMGDMRAFIEASQLPQVEGEMQAMLSEVDGVGVNAAGSAAMFTDDAGSMIILLPVKDYKAFVTARGGVGAGVEEINFGGEDAFVMKVGDDYAALSNDGMMLEDWQPTSGHRATHVSSMGTRSLSAAEAADVFIVGSIAAMADDWREGYEGMKGMAMMFGGPEAAQGFASIDPLVGAFLTDAQTGVVAIDFAEDGVTARLLSRFKEGSMLAGLFSGKSNTGSLLDRVPDMPFALAGAIDTSSPSLRSVIGMVQHNLPQDQAGQAQLAIDMMNKSTGQAFIIGAPSMQEMSIGAGAFVRSAVYYRSQTPDELQQAMANGLKQADGQKMEQEGLTMVTSTSYRPEARSIEGVTVDEWSMQTNFEGEPNEQTMQAQMAMSMMFGSNGLGGYMTSIDDGVIMTMSRNSQMLTQTLATAKGGKGLGASEQISAISNKLPDNRAFEMYVGVDKLLGIGAAFLGDIPPMPPVGIVAASGEDTAEIALHISPAVIAQGMQLADMFGGAMGAPGMDIEDDDEGGPAF